MVPSARSTPVQLTPNAVRYGVTLNSEIAAGGTLNVRGSITLQRAQRTDEGIWTDDPSRDARRIVPVDVGRMIQQHPELAQLFGEAWAKLDEAVAALNAKLKLV